MIFVTGTKRSGTSMWMQILTAGGFESFGTPFSGVWEESIRDANPRGFHESMFRQGVFYATNPHPRTGEWLHPEAVTEHVVKVFIPGLVRSDYTYIHKVVGTMRNWREYGASVARLYEMEDAWLAEQEDGEARLEKARRARSPLPPEVEWWFENFDLIRDVAVRRYPVNLTSYDDALRDPERVIRGVFDWLGRGDVAAAAASVEPSLRSQAARAESTQDDNGGDGVEPHQAELMDVLYDHIDRGVALPASLLQKLNELQAEMEQRWGALSRERLRGDPRNTVTPAESPSL